MKTFVDRRSIVVLLFALLTAVPAQAAGQNYEIRVEGMVCAYCAYTVSKNLGALPGVVNDSVLVDLEHGVATLRSTQALDDTLITETFRDSGFTATDITVVRDAPTVATPTIQIAKIILETDQIGSKMANQLFDVLGESAVKVPSELHVLAPRDLESRILKPLIAGRQRAIKVRYEPVEKNAVEVTLYQ